MATYVSLTNEVLRRLNEVQVDTAGDGFDTLRNVQALAKDAINSSIRRILQDGQEWPFIKTTTIQTLTIGVTTYSLPADYSSADWDTFYIKQLSSKLNTPAVLQPMPYEEYIQSHRSSDDVAPATGLSAPTKVFQTYGNTFGVTPSPDAAYEVEYTYWSTPASLTLYNDVSIIPDRFSHVVIDGAMMHMMQFRSNAQSAQMHQGAFESGIKAMRNVLMDDTFSMRSTYIAKAGQRSSFGIG
jgi:hypothetical protein